MKTKEELLTESGIDWELFEIENEFSAKAILSAMERYTEQKLNKHGVSGKRPSVEYTEGYKKGWSDCCKDVAEYG